MAKWREEKYKNDPDNITFTDPLSETCRKAKRNLLIFGSLGVVNGVHPLKLESLLGITSASGPILPKDIMSGVIALIVVYFLLSFLSHFFVDYIAWNFKRELQKIKPFSDVVYDIELSFKGYQERIDHYFKDFDEPNTALENFKRHQGEEFETIKRKLNDWKKIVIKLHYYATGRSVIRFLSFGILDFLLPVAIGLLALYKNYYGVPIFLKKIFVG